MANVNRSRGFIKVIDPRPAPLNGRDGSIKRDRPITWTIPALGRRLENAWTAVNILAIIGPQEGKKGLEVNGWWFAVDTLDMWETAGATDGAEFVEEICHGQ